MKFTQSIIMALILLLSIFLIGCTTEQTQEELTSVDVHLKYFHQAQFAGNYVAKEQGFYAEENLDVNLVPFSPESQPIFQVTVGEADFGITGANELILARAEGKPLKAIAVIYKISPISLYSLKESGITSPQDFIGKNVGLEGTPDVKLVYELMMKKMDIDRSKINEIEIGFDASQLLAGETDVSSGYVINEPYQVIEAGKEVNIIFPAEYGVNMYADVLFTTENMIENNPELVEGFVSATLEGWQYAIEHEEEAVDHTLKYSPDLSRAHQTYMLHQTIPLIHTGNEHLGLMTEAAWGNIYEILLGESLVTKLDINEVYTNEFVEKAYAKER